MQSTLETREASSEEKMTTMSISPFKVYFAICIFRVLNCLVIQSQFDPDEFWQNLEPAYCEVFQPNQPCNGYTWEWTRRPPKTTNGLSTVGQWISQGLLGPVRSYVSILPTYIFYRLIQAFQLDTSWTVAKGPAILHAIVVAAPTDWAVWYLSQCGASTPSQSAHAQWALFCSLVSWFNAYAMTRTYSNSIEAALFALSLALVGPVR